MEDDKFVKKKRRKKVRLIQSKNKMKDNDREGRVNRKLKTKEKR